MSFKKLVIICAAAYIALGSFMLYQYFGDKDKDKEKKETISLTQNIFIKDDSSYSWFVNDEAKGNYRAPAWLRDPDLFKHTAEVHYSDIPDFKPARVVEYQLTSLFAYLQFTEPLLASSFINPELAYKDYDVRKPNEMTAQAEAYSNVITKNQTIEQVTLILINEQTEKRIYEVHLYYQDGTEATFQIPIINLGMTGDIEYHDYEDEHTHSEDDGHVHDIDEMWFVDVSLSTIASYIQL